MIMGCERVNVIPMDYNGEEINNQEWSVADAEFLDLLISNSPDDDEQEEPRP